MNLRVVMAFAAFAFVSCSSVRPAEEAPLTYQDSGGFFTRPAVDDAGTIYVGGLDKCFWSILPDGKLNWKFPVGKTVLSNPVFDRNGSIWFGSDNHYFYNLSTDGALLWKYKTDGPIESGPEVGPDGTIYVATMNGTVYAFKNRALKWSLQMPLGSRRIKFDAVVYTKAGSTYVIVGTEVSGKNNAGLVLIHDTGASGKIVRTFGKNRRFRIGGTLLGDTLFTSDTETILSISADLTKLNWEFPVSQVHRSHPVLSNDGRTVYQGSRADNKLYALDASTGKLRWAYQNGENIVTTPMVNPVTGDIYFGDAGGGRHETALKPDGRIRWKTNIGHTVRTQASLSPDSTVVYTGGNTGIFYAFDAATGKIRWQYDANKNCP